MLFNPDVEDKRLTEWKQTGSAKYKALETAVFAAAGHFVIEDGNAGVEYKFSQVVKS